MKHTSSILLGLKRNTLFWKSTSNIIPSLNINSQICKVYFKYNPEFQNKYISIESLLQVYFDFEDKYISLEKPTSTLLEFDHECINFEGSV